MTRATLLCLFIAAAPATGQEFPTRDEGPTVLLTLAEAVERAILASAQLRELGQLRIAAGADAAEASAARKPTLDLAAGYSRLSGINEFLIPQPPGEPPLGFLNLPNNYRLTARARLPLYAGGRIDGQIDATRETERAAELDLDASRRALRLETEVAYWGLVTARESARVLRRGLMAFEAHLHDARNRERFGLAARNEVLAVEIERDRAELRRLRAENAAELAEANLVHLLQLPPNAVIESTEPLESAPPNGANVEVLVEQALEARPERTGLLSRVRAAEANVRIAGSATRPQVGVTGGFMYANPNRNFVPPDEAWHTSWDVGVELSMRVFDGGRTSASVARAEANVEALRQRLDNFERRVRLQVTSAVLDVRTAHAAIRVAEGALLAGRENERVSAERYREGVIPSSERLDAEIAVLEAGLERTRTLADARLARANLDRATAR